MAADRAILHADCNGFFASVECLDHPAYWSVPMAVAGDPKDRCGIILAKNELAKRYGVQTTDTIWQARRKCPQLVLVPPHGERYRQISQQINQLYLQYTDQVEPFSIDESFLDITGSLSYFHATPRQLADKIRQRVKREVGITVSVGVSFNKTFAKLGSDMKKPDATTEITRENFRSLVWSLPVRDMLFVGRSAAAQLNKHYIETIGDIARKPCCEIVALLGSGGAGLWRYVNGMDTEPVRHMGEHDPAKSIGHGMTFRRDLSREEEIVKGVVALSDAVASQLRACGMKARSLQVTIKNTQLVSICRQAQLSTPTHLQRELVSAALSIIRDNWPIDVHGGCTPIRAITLTAQQLIPKREVVEQVSFFDTLSTSGQTNRDKLERVEQAMASIRCKYGRGCLCMGFPVDEELGIGRWR